MRQASAILACVLLLPLSAQAAAKGPPHPPAKSEKSVSQLDSLFGALRAAQSGDDARPIEEQILIAFRQSGSASIDLLMSREQAAANASDTKTARQLLDAIVGIEPKYAEAWHQLGILQAAAGEDEAAMISLEKAVIFNPRHFAAMVELGNMLEEYGKKAAALKLFRQAFALDPQLEGMDRHIRSLSKEVEGEPI